ncbi:MAG: GNAT family N-acetyltransferase [Verrucomicrobiales bacterium]|nr:GNAT family N-acetyltransferase [Verrucomicrobiales bacterium]
MPNEIDVVRGQDVTPEQQEFISYWTHLYFKDVTVCNDKKAAPVHWRLMLRNEGEILSQVAITELEIEIDGQKVTAGSIGGLLTPTHLQGNGHANSLMERAEKFIFTDLNLPMGILFCLPGLVPFYARRGWTPITRPVTLQQKCGPVEWGAEVMVLERGEHLIGDRSIHVPNQTKTKSEQD